MNAGVTGGRRTSCSPLKAAKLSAELRAWRSQARSSLLRNHAVCQGLLLASVSGPVSLL